MTTTTANLTSTRTRTSSPSARGLRSLPLAILGTFVFFAAQGHFSFQLGEEAVGGALPGAVPTRVPSLVGDILIPGLAYSFCLFWVVKDHRRVTYFFGRFKMLSLLGVLAAVSALWSQNPLRSLAYGTFYLVGTLFAYWLVVRLRPHELRMVLVQTGLVVCLAGLFLAVVLPKYGAAHDARSLGAWRGIFSNRTAASKVLVFLLTPGFVSWGKKVSANQVSYVLLVTLMLIQLHAVSSFVVLACYLATLAFLRLARVIGRRLSLALFTSITIVGTLLATFTVAYLPDILRAMGRDPTLTGRTTIWAVLLESMMKRPLLGYGFYSFWQGLNGESAAVIHATNWTFGYAHNGYIEIFLQLGLVGGLIFLCTLMNAAKDAWRCFRLDRSGKFDWFVGLFVVTLVYNIDEATVFWPNDLTSILYIVTCCGLSLAVQQLKQSGHFEGAYPR